MYEAKTKKLRLTPELVSYFNEHHSGAFEGIFNSKLNRAVYDGNLDLVKAFITAGSDVHKKDILQDTLLHRAAEKGYPKIVMALINAGINVNTKGRSDETALHRVFSGQSYNRHLATISTLINAGADVNVKNKAGKPILHEAVIRMEGRIVNALIKAGADVNATDIGGETALHKVACRDYNYAGIAKSLIEAGADVHAEDNCGETVLDIARCSRSRKIPEMLIKAGAKDTQPEENLQAPIL